MHGTWSFICGFVVLVIPWVHQIHGQYYVYGKNESSLIKKSLPWPIWLIELIFKSQSRRLPIRWDSMKSVVTIVSKDKPLQRWCLDDMIPCTNPSPLLTSFSFTSQSHNTAGRLIHNIMRLAMWVDVYDIPYWKHSRIKHISLSISLNIFLPWR